MTDQPQLVWVDLETDGLDLRGASILEIAAVVTNGQLDMLPQPTFQMVARFDGHLSRVAPIVVKMHTDSGLWAACDASTHTETAMLAAFQLWLMEVAKAGPFMFAGSGVALFDVPILDYRLPWVAENRQYPVVDVGCVRRLFAPFDVVGPQRSPAAHRAMADVLAHIDEARAIVSSVVNWRDAAMAEWEKAS